MQLHNPGAEIFVPDDTPEADAISRTTLLGIGCHPDDLEILAYPGIIECYGDSDRWFSGITVTNGSGSPRAGLYANYTDEEMVKVRRQEQKKAAMVGEYGFMALLDYPSSAVRDPANEVVVEELKALIEAAGPSAIYTHNPADKHSAHVAVTLRTIQALRELPPACRPAHVYGCELWRDLDWLPDADKVVLDVSAHENVAAALLGIHDSQITGGKRYDLATMGRRRAQATYFESHATDVATGLIFAMDLTPLIQDPSLGIADFVQEHINSFAKQVTDTIQQLR